MGDKHEDVNLPVFRPPLWTVIPASIWVHLAMQALTAF